MLPLTHFAAFYAVFVFSTGSLAFAYSLQRHLHRSNFAGYKRPHFDYIMTIFKKLVRLINLMSMFTISYSTRLKFFINKCHFHFEYKYLG